MALKPCHGCGGLHEESCPTMQSATAGAPNKPPASGLGMAMTPTPSLAPPKTSNLRQISTRSEGPRPPRVNMPLGPLRTPRVPKAKLPPLVRGGKRGPLYGG